MNTTLVLTVGIGMTLWGGLVLLLMRKRRPPQAPDPKPGYRVFAFSHFWARVGYWFEFWHEDTSVFVARSGETWFCKRIILPWSPRKRGDTIRVRIINGVPDWKSAGYTSAERSLPDAGAPTISSLWSVSQVGYEPAPKPAIREETSSKNEAVNFILWDCGIPITEPMNKYFHFVSEAGQYWICKRPVAIAGNLTKTDKIKVPQINGELQWASVGFPSAVLSNLLSAEKTRAAWGIKDEEVFTLAARYREDSVLPQHTFQFLSRSGASWTCHKTPLYSDPLNKGEKIRVKLVNGKPDWASLGYCECYQNMSVASHEIQRLWTDKPKEAKFELWNCYELACGRHDCYFSDESGVWWCCQKVGSRPPGEKISIEIINGELDWGKAGYSKIKKLSPV